MGVLLVISQKVGKVANLQNSRHLQSVYKFNETHLEFYFTNFYFFI